MSLHRRGALWANCSASESQDDTRQAALDLDPARRHQLGVAQIDLICEAFAEVVDAKSHFTFCHSLGVADAAFRDCPEGWPFARSPSTGTPRRAAA